MRYLATPNENAVCLEFGRKMEVGKYLNLSLPRDRDETNFVVGDVDPMDRSQRAELD